MRLLEDVFIIENLQVINEGTANGPMKIRGCFQRADEANNNKRIYRKPLLEREITKLADAMNERRLMGELDHPQHDSVRLSNVSHLITGLNMKGNEVIGEAEILNTPSGKVAKALIDGGVKIGISSRGMGTVTEELDGKRYVNEDFKLITWDIVADPSTRGAYPGLTESTQIQEIIDKVLPEAQKVKNFTTLLKEEISRDKLMEAKSPRIEIRKAKHGVPARKRGGKKPLVHVTTTRTPKKTTKHSRIVGAPGGEPERGQHVAFADSTQFVNFMRDRLNEIKIAGKSKLTSTERTRRAISPKFKKAQAKLAADRIDKLHGLKRDKHGTPIHEPGGPQRDFRDRTVLGALMRRGGVTTTPQSGSHGAIHGRFSR